jgi:UDP-3-O-[3-hydroxymyristoyl] N-acetylglucosamine deacetylase/3-hydroxyacyl-[acyl-carrier-protein] dehydratase
VFVFSNVSWLPAMTARQHTLAGEHTLEGVGVHSGEHASLTMRPAEGGGVRFRRMDLSGCPEIPADLDHVVGCEMGTSLGSGEVRVGTVEHVMAALYATGVDHAVIELRGPEAPIMDGSFQRYLAAVSETGTVALETPAQTISVRGRWSVTTPAGASYVATPADALRVSATIVFDHRAIGRQHGSFDVTEEAFRREIGPARTFGFRHDAEALRARGLARGTSLENTIVLDDDGVMNDGLRFDDEFVRHKIGDLIGDLALIGRRVRGHIVSECPSHEGNIKLARTLLKNDQATSHDLPIGVERIMEHLPHRYPFLLVDRILEFEPEKRIVGLKNVTISEPYFQGHFPGHPVMPGVLIIEAMAQVGGLLLMDTVSTPENKVVYFMSLDKVKWRKPVVPGDQLFLEVEMIQFRRNVCKLRGVGRVDGKVVAEADMMAGIIDR